METKNNISEIIPPNTRDYREGFSNHAIIDELNSIEKKELETELIFKLSEEPLDVLVVQTLAYLKAKEAIDPLKHSLKNCKISIQKVIIAVSIYQINRDKEMIDVAINAAKHIMDDRDLLLVFTYLKDFESEKVNNLIKGYFDHPNFLVSYNAKRALTKIDD